MPSESPAARAVWRPLLLWGIFFVVLVAGLLFAASRGGAVPVLLDFI